MSSAPELKRHPDTGVWYVHWRDGRRTKRVSTREKALGAAQAFFGAWLLMEQEEARRPKSAPTCGELWTTFQAKHERLNSPCLATVNSTWKNLSCAFLSHVPSAVTQDMIDAYAKDRTSGKIGTRPASMATVWRELCTLLSSWNQGVKQRLIASTELPVLQLPPPPMARDRWLQQKEFAAILVEAERQREGPRLSRVERFIWLGIETAGRRAALQTLKWGQVDFDTGVIHLNPPGRRQTKKRRSSVPISDELMPVLKRAYAERQSEFVLDDARTINRSLAAVAKAAGVAGVTPHVLRHTLATWLAMNDVSLWKIAGILGNTAEVTEQTYAKHSPEGLRDAINAKRWGRGNEQAI